MLMALMLYKYKILNFYVYLGNLNSAYLRFASLFITCFSGYSLTSKLVIICQCSVVLQFLDLMARMRMIQHLLPLLVAFLLAHLKHIPHGISIHA
jgi:hypothetical protein